VIRTVEFLKRNITFWVVGATSVFLSTRVEPFKSNFLLAVLASLVVGILVGMIELAIRTITKKASRTTH
jgi:hypothetical protein